MLQIGSVHEISLFYRKHEVNVIITNILLNDLSISVSIYYEENILHTHNGT